LEWGRVKEIAKLSQSMLGEIGKSPEVLEILKGNGYLLSEVVRGLAEESGGLQSLGSSEIRINMVQTAIRQWRLKSVPAWEIQRLRDCGTDWA
jgi:hypothetical protein